jgi:hypothetical protein
MHASGSAKPAISDKHRRLLDVLRSMGAVDAAHARTGDDIVKVGRFPKGQMLAWIQELEAAGLVARTKGHKTHHYYIRSAAA